MIRLHGICHYWDEQMMLPGFVKWHQQVGFDSFTFIDHGSSDLSNSVVLDLAPDWKIIPSRLEWFDAGPLDHEVSEVEASLPTSPEDFKIVLNVTEWIWTPNFKEKLEQAWRQAPHLQAFGSRSASLVDPEINNSTDLLDRHWGYIDYENGVYGSRRWRYAHNQDYGHYHIGRHGVDLPFTHIPEWLLAHWAFAPYPMNRRRRLRIQEKMPESNKIQGLGVQHLQTDQSLTALYESERARSFNLLDFPLYKEYYEYWRQRRNNE